MRILHSLLFVLFLLSSNSVIAGHILSGSITYSCIGANQYEVSLIIYRDCNGSGAPFDDPGSIAVYANTDEFVDSYFVDVSTVELIALQPYQDCTDDFPTFCAEKAVYNLSLFLPPDQGEYTLSYQRCCWSDEMSNIVNPMENGITISTTIYTIAQEICNSQPVIDMPLSFAACPNVPITIAIEPFDADGDSLAYELCIPCRGGGPIGTPTYPGDPNECDGVLPLPPCPPLYTELDLQPGYDANNPFPTTNGITIDPVNGTLEFTPTIQGRFIYGLCITEYRNNTPISYNRHNIETTTFNAEPIAQENYFESGWKMNHTPTSATLLFTSNTAVKTGSIDIFDISGKQQLSEQFQNQNELSIDISTLKQGIYFANIVDRTGTKTFELVVVN